MNAEKLKISVKDVALVGIMVAIIETAKVALGFIPNMEIVSLLFIIYTLCFKEKIGYILATFCLLEGVIHGFGIWWFMYLYVWTILVVVVYIFRKNQAIWFWSILSGAYGLLFGLFCCPVYFVTGGANIALSWWVAGLPFDIIHCISNFVLCLLLFKPLYKVVHTTAQRMD